MKSLKNLFEDAFAEEVDKTYKAELSEMDIGPGDFDRDALQLGVIFEMGRYDTFAYALKQALLNLEADEHFYDDVTGYGKRNTDIGVTNTSSYMTQIGMPRIY